ncbi:MAG: N-6 DNA methylase [bacterium]
MYKHTKPKEKARIEFGDFQTPQELAFLICRFLRSTGIAPLSIVEPTCGQGSFLIAALETFTSASQVLGIDINSSYLNKVRDKLLNHPFSGKVELKHGDFFALRWRNIVDTLPEPLLIIGNPPWVTNSELGSIDGGNLPLKSNFQHHGGLDAITGKSNFDISEWMLIQLLTCIRHKQAILAMLCKTAVARKVLKDMWQNNPGIANAAIYLIDAKKYFNVSVDACLLICHANKRQVTMDFLHFPYYKGSLFLDEEGGNSHHPHPTSPLKGEEPKDAPPDTGAPCLKGAGGRESSLLKGDSQGPPLKCDGECSHTRLETSEVSNHAYVYPCLTQNSPIAAIGIRDSRLIADITKYTRWKHLELEGEELYTWRSGIKHDCRKVMELIQEENSYRNGLGECYDLEDNCIYPFLKSSDLGRREDSAFCKDGASCIVPRCWVIITQEFVGQDTSTIRHKAPKTWRYLVDHRDFFTQRKSSIYKNRPPFAIFAIGDYAFSPWKVAISGLYKKLYFVVIGPHAGKPVMVDDTCYFISCHSEGEANLIAELLNSSPSREFLSSFIFWDAKRPVTVEVLRRIDIVKLADVLGRKEEIEFYLGKKKQ